MSIRRIRLWLWFSAVVLGAAAVACIVLSVVTPFTLPDTHIDVVRRHTTRHTNHAPAITLADFKKDWALSLQRPLYDPPARQVKKTLFHPPPLGLKLQGTIQEPGHTPPDQAIFMTLDGRVLFKGVGQSINKAKIVAIGKDGVKLQYYDQSVTLKLPEK